MCNKSESIAKIAMALVAFSAEVKTIPHDAQNPHFKSQYTSLDHMIDATKPLLQKNGLTVMQFPGGDGEKITIRTMVLHTSGEWIESEPLTLKAVKTDPQGAGSAITYGRRYSYAAALSLSLGDDDDGNSSSHAPQSKPQERTERTYISPEVANKPTRNTANLISEAQVRFANKLKSQKNISDADFERMIAEYGEGNADIKDLTKKQASEFIDFLNAALVLESV